VKFNDGLEVAAKMADRQPTTAAAVIGDVVRGKNPAAERKGRCGRQASEAGAGPAHAAGADRGLEPASPCLAGARAIPRRRCAPFITPSLMPWTMPLRNLDRAAVVRAPDALARRRAHHRAHGTDKPKSAAMTGRAAAYGRAAFAWAVKRGAVQANPFANLPVAKSIAKRERVLSDEIGEIWRAAGDAASPYGAINQESGAQARAEKALVPATAKNGAPDPRGALAWSNDATVSGAAATRASSE
jgi:hypothetical protein